MNELNELKEGPKTAADFIEIFRKNYGKDIKIARGEDEILEALMRLMVEGNLTGLGEDECMGAVGALLWAMDIEFMGETNPIAVAIDALKEKELKPKQRVLLYNDNDLKRLNS